MKQRKIHYAWIILISCCIVNVIAQGMMLGTMGVYMTPIARAPGVPVTLAGGLIAGLGQSVGLVAAPYMSRRAFGGKEVGKISGIVGVLSTICPAVGIVVSASVFDRTGSFVPVFSFVSVMILILTVLLVFGFDRFIKRRIEAGNAS